MLRLLIFSFIVLSVGIQLSSQRFTPIFFGNVTINQVDGDNLSGYNKVGYQLGAGINTYLYRSLSFEVSGLYKKSGSAIEDQFDSDERRDDVLELDISSIQIQAGPRIFISEKLSFTGFFFFQTVLNVKENFITKRFGPDFYEINNSDFNSRLFGIGGDISYYLTNGHNLSFVFQRSNSNLLLNPYPDFVKLLPYSIGVGYRYHIGSIRSNLHESKKRRSVK